MRKPRALAAALTLAATGAVVATMSRDGGATVPSGFTDSLVATVGGPTALAFTPDGRLLVTTQAGLLYVVRNGTIGSSPALDLSAKVCSQSERGLLGVSVDPAFAANGFVYLYYTAETATGTCPTQTTPGPTNRVSRFVLSASDVVAPSSEQVLFDGIPSYAGNHNGGDLVFGTDGTLYVSVGDGGCDYAGGGCGGQNDAARDRHVALGKILRINTDGSTPPDNPFADDTPNRCGDDGFTDVGQHCPETFAWGFRNPFRMAIAPDGGLFVNDVGQGTWEEIDDVVAGADYGWNVREGHCATGSSTNCGTPPAGLTNPIHDYNHSTGCRSITGGAFVPDAVWPVEYRGDYLFADFVCGKIFRLEPQAGGGFVRSDFATGLGASSAVHLEFGPDNALYYTTFAGGGQIRKIVFDPSAPPGSTTFVSDLSPVSATNGYGPVERDMSNGGLAAGDGRTITLNGVTYPKGLGVHAASTVVYSLAGGYQSFAADVGVDDECGTGGTVVFQVVVDGVKLFDSATMTNTSPTKPVLVNTTGKNQLHLVVTAAGDGKACDHADWAGARLTSSGSPTTTAPTTTTTTTTTTTAPTTTTTAPPSGSTFVSDLSPVSATNGYGPVERDMSNGGLAAGDGRTITLNGVTYPKGLGVHAASTVVYSLAGGFQSFAADVGVDDECGTGGTVVFQVLVDGVKLFDSATMTNMSPTKPVLVNTAGKNQLRLVVTAAGDGKACDHADWAAARLT